MTRASATQPRESVAAKTFLRPFLHGRSERSALRLEPIIRAAIPVGIVIFLLTIAIGGYVLSYVSRSEMLANAATTLDALSEQIVHRIERAAETLPPAEPQNADEFAAALKALLPAAAFANGRRLHAASLDGKLLITLADAVRGDKITVPAALAGRALPVSAATQTPVRQITLTDGVDAFVIFRRLERPATVVALVQPVSAALGEWQANNRAQTTILITSGVIMLTIGAMFYWQGNQARDSERRFAGMYERTSCALMTGRCGLWDWNLVTGEIYWSRSMFAILGMAPRDVPLDVAEVRGMIHPDDVDFLRRGREAARGTSEEIEADFRILAPHGDWLWLRARVQVERDHTTHEPHLVGIAVDVTETRQAAQEREVADIRLRDAIEALSSAFVLWDRDNRLVLCNSLFRSLHGLSRDVTTPGRRYNEIMDTSRPLGVETRNVIEDEPRIAARTVEALLEDGRWLHISERRTNDGGFVSVGTDITSLKRHELELIESDRRQKIAMFDLKRSRQELESQAQALVELAERYMDQKAEAECSNRAKSEFLHNMSHELRTPLNAIIGFADMMQNEVYGQLGNTRYTEYAGHIRQSGDRLLGFVNEVLDMASIESGRVRLAKSEVMVDHIIAQAVAGIAETATEKQIDICCETLPDAYFHVDRAAIGQIMRGLLQNAVKFTPDGGSISIRPRHAPGAINIYIEDTGIGIPKEALAKVAKPFEQVENEFTKTYKGSGLGLAIARSLTELHGGAMRIRSVVGSGTIVLVHIPVDLDAASKRVTIEP